MFDLKGSQTSVRTEVIAGITTFVTMAYVMVVNPLILSKAGIPFNQAFTATIIATLVGTLAMAFVANYPIAVAPGMGLNGYFTYSVALAHKGMDYHVALGAVFVSAIIFFILSLTPLRSKLIEAIPENLKYAISAGIGLFIAFLGLRMSGLVKSDPETFLALGNLHTTGALLALFGIAATLVLMVLNVRGALFIGMILTCIIAFFTGQLHFQGVVSLPQLPDGIVTYNPISATLDIFKYGLFGAVFSFLLVTIFDTTGTILGLGRQAGLIVDNKLPRAERALFSDSLATLVGSIFGTSPTSAYIESAAGISAGGRTGLTALVVAVLFTIMAFFAPIISAISDVDAITAPALIIVGSLMMSSVRYIKWDEVEESFPTFLTILAMPMTSSITTGIAAGFIFFPVLKIVRGKWREVHPLVYIFGLLFLIQFIFFS